MTDESTTTPAVTPSGVTTEQRQFVSTLARLMWHMNLDGGGNGLSKEQRQAQWKADRSAYMQTARALTRQLRKHGFSMSKTPVG